MLFLGIEMAMRTKNATLKFFLQVVLELPYKETGGGGSKGWRFFLKSVQNDKSCQEILKKLGVIFFPTKYKSSHNFSTRHFDDKVTSDLDFLAHLAPKNNIVSFSPVLHTPWMMRHTGEKPNGPGTVWVLLKKMAVKP